MLLTLALLAVHLCRGSDIFCQKHRSVHFNSSLIFALLQNELVSRATFILRFTIPDDYI